MPSADPQQEPSRSDHSGNSSNLIQPRPVSNHSRRRANNSRSVSSDYEQDDREESHESPKFRSLPERGQTLPQRPQLTRSGSEPMASSKTALPSSLRAPLPSLQQPHDHTTSVTKSTRTSLSLLLVDDNAINIRILEAFAKKGGHSYMKACNGQEAVNLYCNAAVGNAAAVTQKDLSVDPTNPDTKAVPTKKPEIILMDINMPIMDGFEATRAIRNFEKSSKVPKATIIAVTGLGDTNAQDEAFACGMDLFLTKPVRMKDLHEVFASLDF